MTRFINKTLMLSIVLLYGIVQLAVSCSSPDSVEIFKPITSVGGNGRLEYELDMTDSAKVYDISIFTRIDCLADVFEELTSFPLRIEWFSPTQKGYTETVYLPLESFSGTDPFVHDLCVDYRTGLVPYEYGIWKLYITPSDIEGLRGVGIILKNSRR